MLTDLSDDIARLSERADKLAVSFKADKITEKYKNKFKRKTRKTFFLHMILLGVGGVLLDALVSGGVFNVKLFDYPQATILIALSCLLIAFHSFPRGIKDKYQFEFYFESIDKIHGRIIILWLCAYFLIVDIFLFTIAGVMENGIYVFSIEIFMLYVAANLLKNNDVVMVISIIRAYIITLRA